jgi:predicted ArsR family transcriptional regulator
MKAESERALVLRTIARLPQATIQQVAECIGSTPRRVSAHASNLRGQKLIVASEPPEPHGRGKPKLWTVTPRGHQAIANPGPRRLARPGQAPSIVAAARAASERYATAHARHVARQVAAGIPLTLIHGELPDTLPTSGRG